MGDEALPLRVVARARALFRDLDWPDEPDFEDEPSLFDRFCAMLARLRPDEQDLILTISQDFLYCVLQTETQALRRAVSGLNAAQLNSASKIIAIPLIKPEDVGKAKSGGFAIYLFRSVFQRKARAAGWQFAHCDRPDELIRKHSRRSNALVIMVDDFLGSGETADSAVSYYRDNLAVESDRLLVISLAAQRQALEQLDRLSVPYSVGFVRERGISDSPRVTDKQTALALMEALSTRLGSAPPHLLGHNAAEALVAMRMCPNNTFPVFWTTKPVDGSAWPAPFDR